MTEAILHTAYCKPCYWSPAQEILREALGMTEDEAVAEIERREALKATESP